LDINSRIVYFAGTGLGLALVYYGLRTLKLSKGSEAGRAGYVSQLSSLFFGIVVMFSWTL